MIQAYISMWKNYFNYDGLGIYVVTCLYFLALVIPMISLSIRRLHDIDKAGWWYLLALAPFGGIIMLVFFTMDGTPGPNRFGEDPKGR